MTFGKPKLRLVTAAAVLMALALLAGAGVAQAPAQDPEEGLTWMRLQVRNQGARGGMQVRQARDNVVRVYRLADIEGKGISAATYQMQTAINRAQQRANAVSNWARWDLDGDGRVTREELRIAHLPQVQQRFAGGDLPLTLTEAQREAAVGLLVIRALEADTNRDGVITYAEVIAKADRQFDTQGQQQRQNMIPLSLDKNGDGVVSFEEFAEVLERELAILDADGDGTVSEREADIYRRAAQGIEEANRQREQERRQVEAAAAKLAQCGVPKAPPGHQILHVEADRGDALASVALGGEDHAVSVIDLVIEPGTEPIFVIAESHFAALWRVTGAAGRVKHMIVGAQARTRASPVARAGVVGLAGEVVHIAKRNDCLASATQTEGRMRPEVVEKVRLGVLAKLIGRAPDTVVRSNADSIARVFLPSGKRDHDFANPAGKRALPEQGPGAVVWADVLRQYPAGIVDLDPTSVVASLPVARFKVLPGVAGIAQLLDEGVLEPTDWRYGRLNGREVELDGVTPDQINEPGVVKAPVAFRVKKAMEFPGGRMSLFSIADPRFLVAPGVPRPTGNPGQACVIDEATKAVIHGGQGGRCR